MLLQVKVKVGLLLIWLTSYDGFVMYFNKCSDIDGRCIQVLSEKLYISDVVVFQLK